MIKQWFRLSTSSVGEEREGTGDSGKGVKTTVELGPVTGRHSKSRYLRSPVCVRYPRQVLLPSGPRVNCDEWTPPSPTPRPLQQQLRRTTLSLPPSATMFLQLQHH